MRPVLFLAFFLATLLPLRAQVGVNLVPNPSFEEYDECPDGSGINPWDGSYNGDNPPPRYWVNPSYTTPDYFHGCYPEDWPDRRPPINRTYGYQYPYQGIAHVGLIPKSDWIYLMNEYEWREYIQTRLLKPLRVGKSYILRCQVALSSGSNYQIENFGLLLTEQQITTPSAVNEYTKPIEGIPQVYIKEVLRDTGEWFLLVDTIIADKEYQWVTIGNFTKDKSSTFQQEFPNNGNGMKGCGYVFVDDVSVMEIKNNHVSEVYTNNVLTPNGDGINDKLEVYENSSQCLFKIYDRWGMLIHQSTDNLNIWDGTFKNQLAPAGVYFLHITCIGQDEYSTYTTSLTLLH